MNNLKYPLQSEQIESISEAFGKAQSEFEGIVKDANAGGRYKYAKLDGILGAIEPILNKNNLAFKQDIVFDFEWKCRLLFTRLQHSSGQFFQSYVNLPEVAPSSGRNEHQEFGTAITYYRKYAANCIFGVHPEDDTDGNSPVQKIKKDYPLNSAQLSQIIAACDGDEGIIKKIEDKAGCSIYEIPEKHFDGIINFIKKEKAAVN